MFIFCLLLLLLLDKAELSITQEQTFTGVQTESVAFEKGALNLL
jgi:hypothetical protein